MDGALILDPISEAEASHDVLNGNGKKEVAFQLVQ